MIDSNREEFEKLPEVAQVLSLTDGFDGNRYHSINNHRTADWLNGAWYAFQEQQKKLDCYREENKAHLEKIDEAIVRCKFLKTNGGDRRTLEDIELILKGNKDEN